jgi:hypothetical protein
MRARSLRKVNYEAATPLEMAYIAGFFDGEGHCRYRSPDNNGIRTMVATFTQKRPEVLLWIQSKIGGAYYNRRDPAAARLNFNGYEAAVVLRRMFPYLIVKRVEAYEAITGFYRDRKGPYGWPPRMTRVRRKRMHEFPMDRRLPESQRIKILELRLTGASTRKIAAALGIGKTTASRYCVPHHPVPVEEL